MGGLDCISEASVGAVTVQLPGGICPQTCFSNGECAAGAVCVLANATYPGFCSETCSYGPVDLATFDENKCHGRTDFACSPGPDPSSLSTCLPRCNSDPDCQGGFVCDLRSGHCFPAGSLVEQVKLTGSQCQPGTPQPTCTGNCVQKTVAGLSVGVCSDGCTLGAPNACTDFSANDAACAPSSGVSTGLGDLGECVQLCDCTGDCRHSSLVCVAADAPVRGRAGHCADAIPGQPEINCP